MRALGVPPRPLTVLGATFTQMLKAWGPLFAFDPERPEQMLEFVVLDDDLRDVIDAPPHQLYELQHVVPEVLRPPACKAVFSGLRREGKLASGRAYTGRPSCAWTNRRERMATPAGMCYVVFVTPSGSVFDWDWVPEGLEGIPTDWEKRFGQQLWPARRPGLR